MMEKDPIPVLVVKYWCDDDGIEWGQVIRREGLPVSEDAFKVKHGRHL
jgi:hypothetical protein